MFWSKRNATHDGARVVAIVANKQVVEIWQMYLQRTDFREREIELPKELRTRVVRGRRQRNDVYRRQRAQQEWGHFVIRRYRATRMLPWAPGVGLAMLVPGTLLAAGSANQGITHVPMGLLIIQSALISIGGLLALASGWRVLTKPFRFSDGVPLESLGVLGHALGFPSDVVASDNLPVGYRAGRFKGVLEADISLGEWEVVEEYAVDPGWFRT
jgi:hypothetical protein